MIQRLNRLNLVNYEKHYGVTLTDAGREIALEVIRHHRLVELYLIEALGFGWDEVHQEADILEHVISEQLEERIAAALNNPDFDPHGDPIPSKEGQIASMNYKRLTALVSGARAVVSRIPDDADSELLRYLGDLGLIPGTKLMVLDVAPFDGPLTIEIDGESKIIGYKVASSVLVELK